MLKVVNLKINIFTVHSISAKTFIHRTFNTLDHIKLFYCTILLYYKLKNLKLINNKHAIKLHLKYEYKSISCII